MSITTNAATNINSTTPLFHITIFHDAYAKKLFTKTTNLGPARSDP